MVRDWYMVALACRRGMVGTHGRSLSFGVVGVGAEAVSVFMPGRS